MKRRAFTLIELVVVIALLALLAGLLVMGIGKMQTNSKRQQTRLIMQNLSAMFAEYDKDRRVPFGMGNLNISNVSAPASVLNAIYLPCPGDVSAQPAPAVNDRTATAVQYTRDFMAQLMSSPGVAASIGKLPASALMTFASSYSPGFGLPYVSSGTAWSSTTAYKVFDVATYNSQDYIRTVIYPDSTGAPQYDAPVNAPPNYYYWMPVLPVASSTIALTTPVVLDAWGNPILFVMGGVLGAPSTSTTGGMLIAGGQTGFQVNSPDYHPFFASAGPDGDFSKGDDNLYSFEK